MKEKYLLIGKIVNTHGIKGEIRVVPYTESVESFGAAGEVYIKHKSGPFQKFRILRIRPHKNIYIIALEGVKNISQAELLVGADVYRDKATLPSLNAPDEYYWYEVIGLEVRLITGERIGNIKNVFNAGTNDVFVVYDKKQKKEYLIPSIEDVIDKFDWENKILWIKPLAGLLE